jgi:zinc-binding alcohol dehydrogenase family protein
MTGRPYLMRIMGFGLRAPKNRVPGLAVAGTVAAIGAKVTRFAIGDEVFGVSRGAFAELAAASEDKLASKPSNLTFEEAATVPISATTALQGLRLGRIEAGQQVLIIGASGGVGSIMTQLATRLTSLTVIGTASRPETRAWVKELGAHHVIDHSRPIAEELKRIGIPAVDYIVSLTQTDSHLAQIAEAIAPQGKFGLIDDPVNFDITLFKRKSASIHWELMFTRPLFGTPDMVAQHRLLNEVGQLVDSGLIRTTLTESFGSINAANLRRAHELIESGKARGKVVLEGWV